MGYFYLSAAHKSSGKTTLYDGMAGQAFEQQAGAFVQLFAGGEVDRLDGGVSWQKAQG